MLTKRSLLIGTLVLALLSGGCGAGSRRATPSSPSPQPTSTSPLPFELSPAVAPTPDYPPSLFWDPAALNLEVGEQAAVVIWIDGVSRLQSLLIECSFDPAIIQIEDANPYAEGIQITPGSFPPHAQVSQNRVEGGRITYMVTVEGDGTAYGSGLVLSITLWGVAEGTSTLRLENIAAYDPEGQPIGITPLSDGLIAVGASALLPSTPPAVQPTAGPTSPPGETGIYYVVQPGENLFRIGLLFDTSADDIASANHIADPTQVTAGEMLLIPVPPPSGTFGYYVQPGDTLQTIAQRFGMTADDLVVLNNLGADYAIAAGEVIVIFP